MRKLLKDQEKVMRESFLKYPTKSDTQLAKITKISRPTITKYRKEYSLQIDTEFVAIVAGKFILEFGQAVDHWKVLIDELEELKNGKKTIFHKNIETGGTYTEEVDLEPLDKLALIKEQSNLRARILFLASQGEVREVIKVMRTGQLPPMVTS